MFINSISFDNSPKKGIPGFRAKFFLMIAVLIFLFLFGEECFGLGPADRALAVDAPSATEVDLYEAIQQTLYSYYMRGENIQYNTMKARKGFFSPEEATSQNMNYMVCSSFAKNVYYDLLGISIPPTTTSLLDYARKYAGNPEVILYGETDHQENHMLLYDESRGAAVRYTNMAIDRLLPHLKPGDILVYTGHAMIVYDLIYSASGKVTDARILESGHGSGGFSITSKVSARTQIGRDIDFGNSNRLLYYSNRVNTAFADGRQEGSLHMSTVKSSSVWEYLSASRKERYAVLRFLREENGNILLTYHGDEWGEKDYSSAIVELPAHTRDRLKYPGLYIEKTVNVFSGSTVEAGDELVYRITLINESGMDYTDNIWVTEHISEFAEYESYISSKKAIACDYDSEQGTVRWNIGRIHRGEKVLIQYTAVTKTDSAGRKIESRGTVEHIPSAVVVNYVQMKTPESFSDSIAKAYEELKGSFCGLDLINQIYVQACGVDLDLERLNINELVRNRKVRSVAEGSIALDTENPLYEAVLNHFWGALANQTYAYKEKTVYSYDLKYWSAYEDPDRRADTIYEENFQTGDVLVYSNSKDFTYQNTSGKNPAKRTYITRENGVYAYIFIEGRGFVGINFGADGAAGTRDDRHEFSPAYYTDNDFPLYSNPYENDEALLKFANYQTLFGKDCFVVLRPSLLLYPVPEPEPESEPEPSAEIAGDTESAEPVPGAGAEEAAAARDPRVAAAAFVLLLGAAFCLCIYVLLKCREKDRDGR